MELWNNGYALAGVRRRLRLWGGIVCGERMHRTRQKSETRKNSLGGARSGRPPRGFGRILRPRPRHRPPRSRYPSARSRCSSFVVVCAHVDTRGGPGNEQNKTLTKIAKTQKPTHHQVRQSQFRRGWFFLGPPLDFIPPPSCAFPLRCTPALGALRGFLTQTNKTRGKHAAPAQTRPPRLGGWICKHQRRPPNAGRRAHIIREHTLDDDQLARAGGRQPPPPPTTRPPSPCERRRMTGTFT